MYNNYVNNTFHTFLNLPTYQPKKRNKFLNESDMNHKEEEKV